MTTTITNAPTIALGELKQKIADLQAEVDAGDGSEEYRKCVYWKYALANQTSLKKIEVTTIKSVTKPNRRRLYRCTKLPRTAIQKYFCDSLGQTAGWDDADLFVFTHRYTLSNDHCPSVYFSMSRHCVTCLATLTRKRNAQNLSSPHRPRRRCIEAFFDW